MDHQFDTKVSGIPCICEVLHYRRAVPGKFSGPAEDCYPDEPSEFQFRLLDRKRNPAPWLEKKLTEDDNSRLEDEWEATIAEHNNYMNERDDDD